MLPVASAERVLDQRRTLALILPWKDQGQGAAPRATRPESATSNLRTRADEHGAIQSGSSPLRSLRCTQGGIPSSFRVTHQKGIEIWLTNQLRSGARLLILLA